MKKVKLLFCVKLIVLIFIVQYSSAQITGWTAEVIQPNTTNFLFPGSETNEVIGVKITVFGSGLANLTSLTFNTTGTTNTNNIANAKLWSTSSCPDFRSMCGGGTGTIQVGSTVAMPSGSFTITGTISISAPNTYYYWLCFDIVNSATVGNVIDAECTSVTYNGQTQTPSPTTVAGTRTISGALSPNIVPNPSFETYTACPVTGPSPITYVAQVGLATPWYQPTSGSSDYFNNCVTAASTAGVPTNFRGTQAAKTGNAYVGFIVKNIIANYREYVQTPLSAPLIAGHTIRATMYVSVDDLLCTTDALGMYFSVGPVSPVVGSTIPQVQNTAGNFLDPTGTTWIEVCSTFIAGGGENYLSIGNFKNDASTTTSPGGCGTSYYYLDDVWVEDLTVTGGAGCPVLPIELVSFGGINEGNKNILHWTTASETNNDYFAIERSADAQTFEETGKVKGGSGNTIRDYSFSDEHPLHGTNYYRLKQRDLDGKFTYSQTVSVTMKQVENLTIYPNPARESLQLTAGSLQKETSVEIIDVLGRVILKFQILNPQSPINIDISSLSHGMYYLKVANGAEQTQTRFVKE